MSRIGGKSLQDHRRKGRKADNLYHFSRNVVHPEPGHCVVKLGNPVFRSNVQGQDAAVMPGHDRGWHRRKLVSSRGEDRNTGAWQSRKGGGDLVFKPG
jgi:hypothetical protein